MVPACTELAVQGGTWTMRNDGPSHIIRYCGKGSYRQEGQERALCRSDIPTTPPPPAKMKSSQALKNPRDKNSANKDPQEEEDWSPASLTVWLGGTGEGRRGKDPAIW